MDTIHLKRAITLQAFDFDGKPIEVTTSTLEGIIMEQGDKAVTIAAKRCVTKSVGGEAWFTLPMKSFWVIRKAHHVSPAEDADKNTEADVQAEFRNPLNWGHRDIVIFKSNIDAVSS